MNLKVRLLPLHWSIRGLCPRSDEINLHSIKSLAKTKNLYDGSTIFSVAMDENIAWRIKDLTNQFTQYGNRSTWKTSNKGEECFCVPRRLWNLWIVFAETERKSVEVLTKKVSYVTCSGQGKNRLVVFGEKINRRIGTQTAHGPHYPCASFWSPGLLDLVKSFRWCAVGMTVSEYDHCSQAINKWIGHAVMLVSLALCTPTLGRLPRTFLSITPRWWLGSSPNNCETHVHYSQYLRVSDRTGVGFLRR